MSTIQLKGWLDTGTGRRAEATVDANVTNGVIVAPGGGEAVVVVNNTGVNMARDALVYVSGVAGGVLEVSLADADVADAPAMFYLPTAIPAGASGLAYKSGLSVATLNTAAAGAVDDPVYLSAATAGGWVLVAPAGADDAVQVVGRVAVKDAGVGQIMWAISGERDVGTNELQDLAVTAGKIATDAVTAGKIAEPALGINDAVTIVLDHADGSPAQLLAADAVYDRLVTVVGRATEAAAGGPDIDIGGVTTINGIVDDVGAGVWGLGYRFAGSMILPATQALRATIAAAGTAGAFNLWIHDARIPTITWLNALRLYVADGMLSIATLVISAAPATSFKTTTTTIFRIAGLPYTKVAEDPIAFSAGDTINVAPAGGSFWGVWLVEVGIDGTVHTKPGGGLIDQNYANEVAAIAALPAVTAAHIQLGYITVQCNAGVAFTCNASNLTVGAGAGNCQARTFYNLPAPGTIPAVLA